MALVKSAMLVDGENLLFRYQAMLSDGYTPKECVIHESDKYVWSSEIDNIWRTDFYRVTYYTSSVGDDDTLCELRKKIANIDFELSGGHYSYYGKVELTPQVFKKIKASTKSRLVDINICVDAMRYACTTGTEVIAILSGDGDFSELVRELQRQGRKVCVAAFSSGLADELTYLPDNFVCLDQYFFKVQEENE